MFIRLERLRIEGNDSPVYSDIVAEYADRYRVGLPVEPIVVEECGSDYKGRLYEIKDGKHRYVGAILARKKAIFSRYKGEPWTSSTKDSSSTSEDAVSSQSVSSD